MYSISRRSIFGKLAFPSMPVFYFFSILLAVDAFIIHIALPISIHFVFPHLLFDTTGFRTKVEIVEIKKDVMVNAM